MFLCEGQHGFKDALVTAVQVVVLALSATNGCPKGFHGKHASHLEPLT